MKRIIILALALAAAGGSVTPRAPADIPPLSSLNPNAIKLVLPNDIKWKPAAGLTGTDTYTLVGDAGKPGFYVVLNRFHPGNFSHPHYHANDRYMMVLSGTWWAATGAKDDPEHLTVPIKAGTFAIHKGKEVHFDGARAGSDEAVVMIFGEGPGSRHECEVQRRKKAPAPAPTRAKRRVCPRSIDAIATALDDHVRMRNEGRPTLACRRDGLVTAGAEAFVGENAVFGNPGACILEFDFAAVWLEHDAFARTPAARIHHRMKARRKFIFVIMRVAVRDADRCRAVRAAVHGKIFCMSSGSGSPWIMCAIMKVLSMIFPEAKLFREVIGPAEQGRRRNLAVDEQFHSAEQEPIFEGEVQADRASNIAPAPELSSNGCPI